MFSRIHNKNDAAVIFSLLGYGIWIQVFEFGLSQVIQNALNTKKVTVSGVCQLIIIHYLIMALLAAFFVIFPDFLNFFQGKQRLYVEGINSMAFPLGVGFLLISINNVIVQRLLLMIGRGVYATQLVLLQSIISILVLYIFHWRGSTLIQSVTIYMLIPILLNLPIVMRLARKAWSGNRNLVLHWRWVISNAAGFWVLTAMSSIYLGADYFFASRYLTNEELLTYYFTSRLFFIPYAAYYAYIQMKAKNISAVISISQSLQVWKVTKISIGFGLLSVGLLLLGTIFLDFSDAMPAIGLSGLMDMTLILSASIYFSVRVFRDVGLVMIWNLGRHRLLYLVHGSEAILCLPILIVISSQSLEGKGLFIGMALVAIVSSILIFIGLRRITSRYPKELNG